MSKTSLTGCVVIGALLLTSLVPADDFNLYFGLLHGHTSYSDGLGTPDDAFAMAKQAGLHFMAITEHNHSEAGGDDGIFLTPPLYQKLKQFAQQHTTPQFVAIWGQEVSTISAGNHMNVFFADEICNVSNGDFKSLYETWLPSHPEVPFVQFNHPDYREDQNPLTPANKRNNDYGIDDYNQDFTKLLAASKNYVALIELIIGPAFSSATDKPHQNGAHEADYLFYLNKGFRLAPSVGQDNHKATWGKATHARMGVWATSLTVEALKEAILNRRCYASEDEDVQVKFTVNGKMMGSTLTLTASQVANIHVSVKDDGEPNASYQVKLYYDNAVGGPEAAPIEDVTLPPGQNDVSFMHIPSPGGYYFVKITQHGTHDDDVWTAPVWIAGGVAPLLAAVSANTDDPELDEIPWRQASNYVGNTVTVSGKVIRSHNHQNRIVFFNFDTDYDKTLGLILFSDDFDKFGGAESLQQRLVNKQIRVRGKITLYKDQVMQIRLTSPEQILSVE